MYADYWGGRALEEVANDFGMPLKEMLQEFHQRLLPLREADAVRFPPPPPPEPGSRTGNPRGRKSTYNDELVQAMYARYEAGATLGEIGTEYKVSPVTVGNFFRRAGYQIRPRGTRAWPADLARAMYDRYKAGEPMALLADEYRLSINQMRSCFKQHGLGIKAAASKPQLAEDESKVRAYWERFDAGEELEDVAKLAQLTVGQLRALFQLHHLPLRRLSTVQAKPKTRSATATSVRETVPAKATTGSRRVPRLGGAVSVPTEAAPEPPAPAEPEGPMLEAPEDPHERERIAMQMYSLYEEGKSFSDIAVVFRTSAGLVQQLFGEFHLALKVEGDERRPRNRGARFKGPDRDSGWG